MQIECIVLREVALPLRAPFTTSYGTLTERRTIVVEVHDDGGFVGYGEAAPISPPLYTEESVGTAWHILESYLCPLALQGEWESPEALSDALGAVRRNYAAKAGLEAAVWDAYARRAGRPLAAVLGGCRAHVEVGIALGIPPDARTLLSQVERALEAGYRRIKIKVQPGWDVEPVRLLRRHFGAFPLAVDANAAYRLEDADHLRRLDEFSLEMIEQPLDWEDFVDHAALQRRLATPICLDESITSLASARQALALGSCSMINIKAGRVGGLTPARRIHDLCRAHGIPVWCGGLLESGVGRAHSLALSALPNFTLPADLAPPDRYLVHDVIAPPLTFSAPGMIALPEGAGIGVTPSAAALAQYTVRRTELRRPDRLKAARFAPEKKETDASV